MADREKEIERKTLEVVAAILRKGDCIFGTEKGYGEWKGFWEFPGGKVEAGERPEEALLREIREELDAEIRIDRLFKTVDFDYPHFHVRLHCYFCTLLSERMKLLEATERRTGHGTVASCGCRLAFGAERTALKRGEKRLAAWHIYRLY